MKYGALIVVATAGLLAACSGDDTDTEVAGGADASSDSPPPPRDAGTDAADAGPDPCAEAGVPASTLACTGLYANFATKEIAPNALSYTPASLLWSDGAQKQRWIELPPNTQIDITNPDEWTFPVGTKLFKEFRVDGQRVETRMFQKTTSDFWVYATYAWSPDASSAPVNYGGPVPVGTDGGTWNIPTNDDCAECHRGRQDRILGFEEVSLGLPTAQGLTLAELVEQGLVTPTPASTSLTIGDDGTGLNAQAMGWIHVNCGVTCHNSNPAAAGYGAGMLLRLHPAQLDGTPPSLTTWDILSTTVNVLGVSGSVAGETRIIPGDPADSALYQLMDERGELQMPPIASLIVDTSDVAVVGAWIQAMGADAGAPLEDAGEHDAGHHGDGGRIEDGGGHEGGPGDAGFDATLPDSGIDASDEDGGAPDSSTSDANDATASDAESDDAGD